MTGWGGRPCFPEGSGWRGAWGPSLGAAGVGLSPAEELRCSLRRSPVRELRVRDFRWEGRRSTYPAPHWLPLWDSYLRE